MADKELAERKAGVRRVALQARRTLTPEARAAASAAIAARAAGLPELQGVGAVLAYGAMPDEVDVTPLIAALRARGVRVALPRVAGEDHLTLHWQGEYDALVPGAFGLREPPPDAPAAAVEDIEVALVPGVAFDARCNRLGMGKGYYDRLLATMPAATTVGVAFDEQLVAEVPVGPHDRTLEVVLTPSAVYRSR